jgi:hypothetical protein
MWLLVSSLINSVIDFLCPILLKKSSSSDDKASSGCNQKIELGRNKREEPKDNLT